MPCRVKTPLSLPFLFSRLIAIYSSEGNRLHRGRVSDDRILLPVLSGLILPSSEETVEGWSSLFKI